MEELPFPEGHPELTELHSHVGSAVSPEIMWSIAHSQGIKIKGKDYWAFRNTITVWSDKVKSLDEYLELFNITELIQSSPEGMEKSVYSIVTGAYRKNLITRLELRFNPMLRNRGGERDLDHIILAAVRGMDRATLEYPVQAGLILMLDRRFDEQMNGIILDKAVSYRNNGVIGVDVGGPYHDEFDFKHYEEAYARAAKAGLGLTAHAGETSKEGVREAVELGVTRIGHGVHSTWDDSILRLLRDRNVTLEVCPTSNLRTRALKSEEELAFVIAKLKDAEVKFTVNTDGPEMLCTSLLKERALLKRIGAVDEEDLAQCEEWAREASFLA